MSRGVLVWFTGLPASGKSTLARRVREQMVARGRACCLLDGDELREALVPSPGYSKREREDFYATLGRLASLLCRQDLVVLVAATAHRRSFREHARELAPRYLEVYVAAPLEECRKRDVKGLYTEVPEEDASLPGRDADYEIPEAPDAVASGGQDEAALAQILAAIEGALENRL